MIGPICQIEFNLFSLSMDQETTNPSTPIRSRKIKRIFTITPIVEKKRKISKVSKTKEPKKPKKAKLSLLELNPSLEKTIKKFKPEEVKKYQVDCCSICTSREVMRIASEKNYTLLKEILEDKQVTYPFIQQCNQNVFDIAFKNNDLVLLKMLIQELKEPKKRDQSGSSFSSHHRGQHSRMNHGFQLNISQGRGNKEGNDAFVDDDQENDPIEVLLSKIPNYSLSKEIFDYLSVEIEEFKSKMVWFIL
jgi:hypothetical protein